MSRIAGILTLLEPTLIETMLAAARVDHRWRSQHVFSGQASLGWCGWRAPNLAATNGVAVSMDGCIYNRAEFGTTNSDAGLFAEAYARYGFEEAVRRLNGDFAIALYDADKDTLWLARDRFGIKPLYYSASVGRFAFASQPRALLALPGVTRAVNRQFIALFAASHYRYFDNDHEASPYADIAQLPAAHVLCFKNGQVRKSRYWSLADAPDFTEPEQVLADRYRELLLDAVRLRLASAHRPGFTLSGGMDSSSVLASAKRVSGSKQHAFSTVYADKTYDESEDIRPMLEATVEQWHPVAVNNPDVLGLVQRMVATHDEPVATATWLSHFLLCEETARQGFDGLFGGLGGDELNAGEYEHFFFFFADLRAAGEVDRLAREIPHWIRYHNHPIFRKSREAVEDGFARLVDFTRPGRCRPDRVRLDRYRAALNPEYFDLGSFEPVMEHPFRSYLKNRTYQDILRETIPCCLRAEDRQATAFGLDNFLPFFDYRLVEFMFRVPGQLKYRDGVTKHLLREAMRGVLPEETRTRIKKTGWNAPAHMWFSGPGRETLLDLVHSRVFQQRGIYQVKEVMRLIDEHEQIVVNQKVQDNHMMFLWQLVNLELWLEGLDVA